MRCRLFLFALLLMCAQMLLVAPTVTWASASTTECDSVSSDGTIGDSRSGGPSLSADGRYVAFESDSTNLVANGSSLNQVYLHDRAIPANTVMVSVKANGAPGNNVSRIPSISADGRTVAFVSSATDLVDGDSNGCADVFVRDMSTNTTERISVDSNGVQANGDTVWAVISADGRYVAFQSLATNLVSGVNTGHMNIYVRDLKKNTTELISVSSDGAIGDGDSIAPFVSGDGRYVTFSSIAKNLTSSTSNGCYQVYVRDRFSATTEMVSMNGDSSPGNADSGAPCISTDGRYVAFVSTSSNLMSGVTGSMVYVYDRQGNTIEMVSRDSSGNPADADITFSGLAMSPDGRYVSFDSTASNLVGGDTLGKYDVFIHDRLGGNTEVVSVDDSDMSDIGNGDSWYPAMSVDGRFITYNSYASNLVPNDTNDNTDVFIHDRGADGLPTNPEVTVLTPTTMSTYATQSSTVDIQGIAVDAQSLTGVTWKNKTTGATGSCTGSAYWIANGIPIQAGSNTIVITASDSTAHTGSATLTVTAPGGVQDTTPPTVSISTPTSNPYSTNSATLAITGTSIG